MFDDSSLALLRSDVRAGLKRVALELGNQEKLAHVMGYASGAQLSKILRGDADLPVDRAEVLDREGFTALGEVSFIDLATEITVRRRGPQNPQRPSSFDLFLAVPMASTNKQGYEVVKKGALDLVHALQNACNYNVYCAALEIGARAEFDAVALAWEDNVTALRASTRFAMWIPQALRKPSSVWVEAGYALALGLPCVAFVPDVAVLPYVLKEASKAGKTGSFHAVTLTPGQMPADLVRKNRGRLFKE